MITERSAGIIAFTKKQGERKYLLLLSSLTKRTHWEFPKGQIEKGEDARTAACREFVEESGIEDWDVIEGFQKSLNYFYRREEKLVSKTVTYFLGIVHNDAVTISEESSDYLWLPYEDAKEKLKLKSLVGLLDEAEKFIKQKGL
jgi:bis(5'-nucleosidyl)-tetraphosphatase